MVNPIELVVFILSYQVFFVSFVVSQYHRCAVEEKRRTTSSVCSLVDSFLDIKSILLPTYFFFAVHYIHSNAHYVLLPLVLYTTHISMHTLYCCYC